MDQFVELAARLVEGARLAYARKWSFLGIFAVAFFASTFVLGQFDLLPNPPSLSTGSILTAVSQDLKKSSTNSIAATIPFETSVSELPVKIEIPSIDLTTAIANPESTAVETLDALLLKGAVRYPTSAKLGEKGNVVVFGHSSYLPVVFNPAYKSFNGIQKLKKGDVVTIYSAGTAYTYAVRTMEKKSANDATIQLAVSGKVLTLATCNSFGTKDDRFVVTADFVESHPIGA